MGQNIGSLDRGLRIVVGLALLAFAFYTQAAAASVLLFWGALVVGSVLLLTAVVKLCPLYRIFGLKTCTEC